MSETEWALVAIGLIMAVPVALLVARARHRRRPMSQQETLQAAKQAAKAIRRQTGRPNRDHLEAGDGIGERHSHAIIENAYHGDAAGGGGGD